MFHCDFVRNIGVSVTFAALLINENSHHYDSSWRPVEQMNSSNLKYFHNILTFLMQLHSAALNLIPLDEM